VAENSVREALEELLDYLEQVETQSEAVLQFLRDNSGATEEKLALYLEKAGNATEIKSRAIRARFDFLFTTDDAKRVTEGVEANLNTRENSSSNRDSPESDGDVEKAA